MSAEERREQWNRDEFHEEQKWSPEDLAEFVRDEIEYTLERHREDVLAGMGLMTIEGRVEYTNHRGDDLQIRIGYTDLVQFLHSHFEDGDRVRLLVAGSSGGDGA